MIVRRRSSRPAASLRRLLAVKSRMHLEVAVGRRIAVALAAAVTTICASCNARVFESADNYVDCGTTHERECVAAMAPVSAQTIQVGIAGVAVGQSDVGTGPGCFPCWFTSRVLDFFATEGIVTEVEVAEQVVLGTPTSIDVVERYEVAFPAGAYLVCAGTACAPVSVAEGGVATANAMFFMGGAAVFTFGADGSEGPPSFEVSRPQ